MKRSSKFAQQTGGQVLVVATVLFLFLSLSVVLSSSSSVIRGVRVARDLEESRRSFVLAESLNEDLVYRLREGMNVSATELLSIDGNTATGTIVALGGGGRRVTVSGDVSGAKRRIETELQIGSGVAFNFGVQSGEGGLSMANSSFISGNAYSNGPVTGSGNLIKGDVVSAGPTGFIDGIHATGTGYAHSIQNSTLDVSAYYWEDFINSSTPSSFPMSVDQSTSSLPIADQQIEDWKADAEAGGTYTGPCPYVIDTTATIGPIKIPCDLNIQKSSADVSLAGNVWVEGSFITDVGKPTIRVDASLGNKSVVIVADDPLNRTTSSKIELRNGAIFMDSGTEGSYILLISQNNSAENSGTEKAIDITQSATGEFLVYAGHGEISIAQSASLREVTAYKISLSQSTEVIYETGLASLLFTSGPGGGYTINDWEEIE